MIAKLNDKMDWLTEKYYKIILGVICLVYVITRLFRLAEVPSGMHFDELGIAFDSLSMATDHIDRYWYRFPVYFINFGGGMNAMYIYVLSVLIAIFGYSKFLLRLPSVIFGLVLTICVYYLGMELFKSKKAALFSTFMVMICPYFFMAQRWALESPLLVTFFTVGIYLMLRGVATGKYRYYIFAGVFYAGALYTYAISYLIIPMFLLLTLLYLWRTGKLEWRKFIAMGGIIFVLAIPLFLFLAVQNGFIEEIKMTYFSVPKLPMYRSGEITLANLPNNLYMLKNLLTFDWLAYTALPEFGTVYYISIPLVLYGLFLSIKTTIASVKKKSYDAVSVVLLMFLCIFVIVMVLDSPTISRAGSIYLSIMIFVAIAVKDLYHRWKTIVPTLIILYSLLFAGFCIFYFNVYPVKYSTQLNFGECYLGEAIDYYDEQYDMNSTPIYVDVDHTLNAQLEVLLYTRSSALDWDKILTTVRNYHIYWPEEIDADAWYLVHKDNEEDQQELKEAGLSCMDSYHHFELWMNEE